VLYSYFILTHKKTNFSFNPLDLNYEGTAHHKQLLTIRNFSPWATAHREQLLTVSNCSPWATAHREQLLTVSNFSPWATYHREQLLTMSNFSPQTTAPIILLKRQRTARSRRNTSRLYCVIVISRMLYLRSTNTENGKYLFLLAIFIL